MKVILFHVAMTSGIENMRIQNVSQKKLIMKSMMYLNSHHIKNFSLIHIHTHTHTHTAGDYNQKFIRFSSRGGCRI